MSRAGGRRKPAAYAPGHAVDVDGALAPRRCAPAGSCEAARPRPRDRPVQPVEPLPERRQAIPVAFRAFEPIGRERALSAGSNHGAGFTRDEPGPAAIVRDLVRPDPVDRDCHVRLSRGAGRSLACVAGGCRRPAPRGPFSPGSRIPGSAGRAGTRAGTAWPIPVLAPGGAERHRLGRDRAPRDPVVRCGEMRGVGVVEGLRVRVSPARAGWVFVPRGVSDLTEVGVSS